MFHKTVSKLGPDWERFTWKVTPVLDEWPRAVQQLDIYNGVSWFNTSNAGTSHKASSFNKPCPQTKPSKCGKPLISWITTQHVEWIPLFYVTVKQSNGCVQYPYYPSSLSEFSVFIKRYERNSWMTYCFCQDSAARKQMDTKLSHNATGLAW